MNEGWYSIQDEAQTANPFAQGLPEASVIDRPFERTFGYFAWLPIHAFVHLLGLIWHQTSAGCLR